ncbi:SRPBCC family protein [Microbacterium sp. NM3R9]|uniref:SRPBCC family protein n=1 Tax=Microbacterium thalli TaxID=3027921 RepID=UPI0023652DBF|nr:SRPBCC family protein [Microbacterium thalli]MDD7928871.1 SRPBCC family protein [Microbacterium thalli]MDN8547737.1 SRPBCC family protein [Microbacterium thalli]
MARSVRVMNCAPEDVFAVLGDGWLFPAWVVGASRMRDVADTWPREGSRLHHSFGVWPFVIDDTTSVLEFDPPRRMVLQARGWPIGEARVTLDVKPRGEGCVVRLQEFAAEGPGSFIPQPLLDPALMVRNAETLRRLAHLAEGGAGR